MKEKLNEIILSEIEAEFQMYSDKEFTTKLQRRGLVADIVDRIMYEFKLTNK